MKFIHSTNKWHQSPEGHEDELISESFDEGDEEASQFLAQQLSPLRQVPPGFETQLRARLKAQWVEVRPRPWWQRPFAMGASRLLLTSSRWLVNGVATLLLVSVVGGVVLLAVLAASTRLNGQGTTQTGTQPQFAPGTAAIPTVLSAQVIEQRARERAEKMLGLQGAPAKVQVKAMSRAEVQQRFGQITSLSPAIPEEAGRPVWVAVVKGKFLSNYSDPWKPNDPPVVEESDTLILVWRDTADTDIPNDTVMLRNDVPATHRLGPEALDLSATPLANATPVPTRPAKRPGN